MSYGMDADIGLSFQNSYGTSNVASMHWLEPISESVELKKEQLVTKGLRGIYDEGIYSEGANKVEGDVTIEAKPIILGALLSAVLNRTTVTSGSLYTHTFKPRTTDWDTLSAERPFTYHKHMGDTGSAHIYSDLNGNTLELALANGEMLTAKLGIVGGSYAQAAGSTASYPAGTAINWLVASCSIAGVARDNVRALTVSLDNKLEAKLTLSNSRYPKRIKRTGPRTVSVSGTLSFTDQTDYQNFVSQTEQRLVMSVVGALSITSGYNETLTIDVPSMRFTEYPQAIGGPGELECQFKAVGVYNTGSATSIAITLINSKAGY